MYKAVVISGYLTHLGDNIKSFLDKKTDLYVHTWNDNDNERWIKKLNRYKKFCRKVCILTEDPFYDKKLHSYFYSTWQAVNLIEDIDKYDIIIKFKPNLETKRFDINLNLEEYYHKAYIQSYPILKNKTKEEKDRIYYHSKNQFKDIMRGYFMNYWISSVFYLRSLDYSQISIDTLIEIPFLSDKGKYNYKMKYLGSKKIKSLNKKSLSALTFSPVVPENKLFSGESPVTFWLSDDDRKIPLRLSASMRFGEFDIETVDFDNMIDDKSKEIIYNKYK